MLQIYNGKKNIVLGSVLFYHDNFTADQGICDQDGVYTQTVTLDDQTVFLNCYNKRIVMQHYSESISKDAINPFDVLVEDYYKGINGNVIGLNKVLDLLCGLNHS